MFLRWFAIGAVTAPFLIGVERPPDEVEERLTTLESDVDAVTEQADRLEDGMSLMRWELRSVKSRLYADELERRGYELVPSEEKDLEV